MARLVKNFIGGLASKVTGGEVYDYEPGEKDEQPQANEKDLKLSSGSDDDEESEEASSPTHNPPCVQATLSKWTNYLLGWQDRYVVVRDGILSYYKSEIDLQYGCRGSVSLHKAKILLHEFDELRFDLRAHDCTYFFRASNPEEKQNWIDVIEANKKYLAESGFGQVPITRQGSILSLSALSQASTSSFKTGHDLQVKLQEMDTYRDILCKQVDTLQAFFDFCAESSGATTANGDMGRFTNGVATSDESLDEVPEEERMNEEGKESERGRSSPSTNVSFSISRPDAGTSEHRGTSSNSTQCSPSSSRTAPQGHRRTGSDPFSFRQTHLFHNRPSYLTRFTTGVNGTSLSNGHVDPHNIDFRGEAITFKATTAGILSSLAHCIDIIIKREEYWQKKFEKEQERRRKAERAAHSAINGPRVRAYEYAGPDFEEGPHSALNEDEFFDALEIAYQEDEGEICNTNKTSRRPSPIRELESSTSQANEDIIVGSQFNLGKMVHRSRSGVAHRMTPMVDAKVSEYAQYVFEPVDSSIWSLVHEDAEMKVYRRELEENGVVVDPLKAQYTVKGVSAKEVSNYFYEKDTRMDWEGTVEKMNVVEVLTEDTAIFHQLHKRVWPSTQRETVFCSHICTLIDAPKPENSVGHTWMVCNFSVDVPSIPINKLIRATLYVGLVAQTIANRPVRPGEEASLTRNDVSCRIIYAANVNPGGWAPPSVVRTIAKREICKFLRKFSGLAYSSCSNSPLSL